MGLIDAHFDLVRLKGRGQPPIQKMQRPPRLLRHARLGQRRRFETAGARASWWQHEGAMRSGPFKTVNRTAEAPLWLRSRSLSREV